MYETGPVFQACNANSRRHVCEFTGFDLDMVIHEHYDDILEISIFDGRQGTAKERAGVGRGAVPL